MYHIASLAERSGWDKYQVARQRRYESRIAVNLIDFCKKCTHPNQKRCQLYTIKAWTWVARSIFQTTWDAPNHFFSCLVGISPVWLGYIFCVGMNTFMVLGPVLWGGEARACRTSNSVVKGRGPTPIHWVSENKPLYRSCYWQEPRTTSIQLVFHPKSIVSSLGWAPLLQNRGLLSRTRQLLGQFCGRGAQPKVDTVGFGGRPHCIRSYQPW